MMRKVVRGTRGICWRLGVSPNIRDLGGSQEATAPLTMRLCTPCISNLTLHQPKICEYSRLTGIIHVELVCYIAQLQAFSRPYILYNNAHESMIGTMCRRVSGTSLAGSLEILSKGARFARPRRSRRSCRITGSSSHSSSSS